MILASIWILEFYSIGKKNKAKINKLDHIKQKKFCLAKKYIPLNGKNYLGLISKTYKGLIKFNRKQILQK